MDLSANDISQVGPGTGSSVTGAAPSPNSNLWSQFMALFGGSNPSNGTTGSSPMNLPGSISTQAGAVGGAGAGGAAGTGLNTAFGANIGTGQLALGGLQTLGNLWTAWNAEQLAQKSFAFNKQLSSDNYTNQADSYNTNLANIGRSRAAMENQSPATAAAYVNNNSLKTTV